MDCPKFFSVTLTRLCCVSLCQDVLDIDTNSHGPSDVFCLLFRDKTLFQLLAWNQIASCKNRLSAFISVAFFTGLRQMKHFEEMKQVYLVVSISPKRQENALTHTYRYLHTSMSVHTDYIRLNVYKFSSVFRVFCWWILLTQKY